MPDKGRETIAVGSRSAAARRKRLKKHIRRRSRYVFTDNSHPPAGILSALLGIIAITTIVASIVISTAGGGVVLLRYAVSVTLAALYSIAGLTLGIYSRCQKNIFSFFPDMGIVLNSVSVIFLTVLFIIGLRYAG